VRIQAGGPVSREVQDVFVDGERVTDVFALDDEDGWVTRHTGKISDDGLYETERLDGVVTVTFRAREDGVV